MCIFDYDSQNEDAINYGKRYWGVILPDGRYIYLHADLIATDGGCLVAMREIVRPGASDGFTETTLALSPGQWSAFFAANALTGEPVCVDRTSKV